MEFIESLSLFLQSALQLGTPLLFGTLGGILCEKAGHLNLGIEGMMLMGAVMGFFTALHTGNPVLSLLVAFAFGALGALLYAIVTVTFQGNQTVTGLVLSIFGTGFSSFIGQSLSTETIPTTVTAPLAAKEIPLLCDIPLIGNMLFDQSLYVHAGIVIAILMYIYLNKTRAGLNLRMIGENPGAADASGINITLYKYIHILVGGGLCGLGGGYLTLVYVPRWQNEMTSGMGWISVALIIVATWNPLKAIIIAYLFGMLRGVGFKLQNAAIPFFGSEISISSQFLDMLPYIMTIVVLVFIALRKKRENQPPAWLSNSYFREDR